MKVGCARQSQKKTLAPGFFVGHGCGSRTPLASMGAGLVRRWPLWVWVSYAIGFFFVSGPTGSRPPVQGSMLKIDSSFRVNGSMVKVEGSRFNV